MTQIIRPSVRKVKGTEIVAEHYKVTSGNVEIHFFASGGIFAIGAYSDVKDNENMRITCSMKRHTNESP
jgi:hypothetical protein